MEARNETKKLNAAGLNAKLLEACGFVCHCWHRHTFGPENKCSQTLQHIHTNADTHFLCVCV